MKRITIMLLAMMAVLTGCDLVMSDGTLFGTIEEENAAGIANGFAGGNGTAENPYLISSAEQFRIIGTEDFQNELLKGENDDLYFRLTADIDLSDQEGYVAEVFSGTLDGDGHTIYGSNNMPYIFYYYLEDTTFCNLNIEFADSNISRLFVYPLLCVEKDGNNYVYDKAELNLVMDNVDFVASSNGFYPVDDNNFAFYVPNGVANLDLYYDGDYILSFLDKVSPVNAEKLSYQIELSDCDVSGNFIGGFGGSGAAVFTSGQFYGAEVNMTDCSFDGSFVGLNVSLLIANGSECDGSEVTADNVTGSTIYPYSDNSSLYFAVSTPSSFSGMIPGVTGTFEKREFNITLEPGTKNSELNITADGVTNADRYEVKLYLPSMYWYTDGTYSTYTGIPTNSNTFTIAGTSLDDIENLYAAKVISKAEADRAGITAEWDSSRRSEEGLMYSFVENDGQWYLVIDYEEAGLYRLYTKDGFQSDLDYSGYMKKVVVIAMDSSGSAVGVGYASIV